MKKDFWLKSKVAVLGGGSWGSVLSQLVSENCSEVRLWVRSEEQAREINSTRNNSRYFKDFTFDPKVRATHEIAEALAGGVEAVIWVLPSRVVRDRAKEFAGHLKGNEVILHGTKGVEPGSLKRVSTVLREELPCRRIGVISGPNLAAEIARKEPAGTVVSSRFEEVIEAGRCLLTSELMRVYGETDVVGVEWAGTLKNILSIASGCVDGLHLGMNVRSMLIARGLKEMVRFGTAMGGQSSSFLGLAGVGDLLATCMSPLSRNYQVGFRLSQGKSRQQIEEELHSTAEGIGTAQAVWEFARSRKIPMPITHAVNDLLDGLVAPDEALRRLMVHPEVSEVMEL